jgi:hypothetical protein
MGKAGAAAPEGSCTGAQWRLRDRRTGAPFQAQNFYLRTDRPYDDTDGGEDPFRIVAAAAPNVWGRVIRGVPPSSASSARATR